MIESLIVKNFALIKEAHIDFKNNLNVITGETGSGKSILLGSINLVLGKKASKDYIKEDGSETSATISFYIDDEKIIKYLDSEDIILEDGRLIISRKITKDKSINKINDEPCTLSKIKNVTEKLIDIYGQHDGEDLRKGNKHIDFLDDFIGDSVYAKKKDIAELYNELNLAKEKLDTFNLDEKMRLREIDILKYEIDEYNDANIKDGEEEKLVDSFKLAKSAKNIVGSIAKAQSVMESLDISTAIREIKDALKYDDSLEGLYQNFIDIESLVSDTIKELDKKNSSYDFDEEELSTMESRLDVIRSILAKYDNSLDKAKKEIEEKVKRLDELNDYDNEKKKAIDNYNGIKERLYQKCRELTDIRLKGKKSFEKELLIELKDLGFNDAEFNIDIKEKSEPTRSGIDEVTFMVSLNKGEKLKALSDVASGGELSRIMLSIKTILSENYGTNTLIFDEIDAGISGITASKVAKKLDKISKNHQVILITHLPQIAAMADNHFVIEKSVKGDKTITTIKELDENGMVEEIGRLISTDGELTKNVIANARELKENAKKEKDN